MNYISLEKIKASMLDRVETDFNTFINGFDT